MPVEDVFSISGRGTVVTGRVERGIIKVGEEIEIVGITPTQKTICTGVEMFRKLLDQGQAGDNVGILLRGTKREDVHAGIALLRAGLCALFPIGLLWCAGSREHRSLQDVVLGTLVIHDWSPRVQAKPPTDRVSE